MPTQEICCHLKPLLNIYILKPFAVLNVKTCVRIENFENIRRIYVDRKCETQLLCTSKFHNELIKKLMILNAG